MIFKKKNKITFFLVFLKSRPSSYKFHKLIIKLKNSCKDINKTIFLVFFYLRMLNHTSYFLFIYANMIFLFICEKLDHMQFEINLYILKERFLLFLWKETNLFNTKKYLVYRSQFQILNIRGENVGNSKLIAK